MTPLKGRVDYVPISIPLKLWMYLVPFLKYSATNNGVTLKLGLGSLKIIKDAYHSKAWVRFPIRNLE